MMVALERYRKAGTLKKWQLFGVSNVGVEPKIGVKTTQIIHLFIGFSMIFTIHFGGFAPIFGNTHVRFLGDYIIGFSRVPGW